MHVAFDSREHDRALLGTGLLLHLRLKVSHGLLHHAGGIEHGGQLHLACPEQLTHGAHPVQQDGIDQIQRRVLLQSIFQQLFQSFPLLAFADRLFSMDDGILQLVIHRQRFHVRRDRRPGLAPHPGKVLQVPLQRIALRLVTVNQLARELNLFLRNLV